MAETQIANRLPELRARHRLTQQALATQVGVARQTIVAIEKGQYNPSLLLAFKIAHCFGEPLEAVFQFRPPVPEPAVEPELAPA